LKYHMPQYQQLGDDGNMWALETPICPDCGNEKRFVGRGKEGPIYDCQTCKSLESDRLRKMRRQTGKGTTK